VRKIAWGGILCCFFIQEVFLIYQGNKNNARHGNKGKVSSHWFGKQNWCVSDGVLSSIKESRGAVLVREDGSILSVTIDLCEMLDGCDSTGLLGKNFYSFIHGSSRLFFAYSLAMSAHVKGTLGPIEIKLQKTSKSIEPFTARFSRIPVGEKPAIYVSFHEAAKFSSSLNAGFVFDPMAQDALGYSFVDGLLMALDVRDSETLNHSKNVIDLTVRLGQHVGLSSRDIFNLKTGALLHDIGKLAIPDSVLRKTGPLSDSEWVIMKRHPEIAKNMLSPFKSLRPAIDIPYSHHERWNGSGYPNGLDGENIPLPARIFAVVDVYDALSNDRCYRDAWDPREAEEYIKKQSGVLFDPDIVNVFLQEGCFRTT
jgi:hypothetical protein